MFRLRTFFSATTPYAAILFSDIYYDKRYPSRPGAGYVFNFNDARAYEEWVVKTRSRTEADLENRLMIDMLKPIRGESLLDIGCGTGASIEPFYEKGLQVTGIDPSP